MTFLTILLSALGYLAMVAVIYGYRTARLGPYVGGYRRDETGGLASKDSDEVDAFLFALFWFLVLPVSLAVGVGRRLATPPFDAKKPKPAPVVAALHEPSLPILEHRLKRLEEHCNIQDEYRQ